jgi:hypothetical protein
LTSSACMRCTRLAASSSRGPSPTSSASASTPAQWIAARA